MAGAVQNGNIVGAERRYREPRRTVLNRSIRRAEAAFTQGRYVALPYPKLLATALSSRLDMHLRLERRL